MAAPGDVAAGEAGATDGAAADGAGGDAAGVTYQAVKPILAAKCVPCHMTGGTAAAQHTMASEYDGANSPSVACTGKTKGACAVDVVKSGFMPFMRGCTGNPAMDTGKAQCLTAEEQQRLADWVAGGLQM
jgi:hypothetical protein